MYVFLLMSLTMSCDDNINMKEICKNQIISMIMENATEMGWRVEKKKKNVYILRKKIDKLTKQEKNTEKLVDMILDIRKF
jgi:hypothetical protein